MNKEDMKVGNIEFEAPILLTQYPAVMLANIIADSISLPSSNLYIRRLMKISPKSHRNLIEKIKNAFI